VTCPVCGESEVLETVRRERLPPTQNYVYRTRDDAERAPSDELSIAVFRVRGLPWNRHFDSSLLVYDAGSFSHSWSTQTHR